MAWLCNRTGITVSAAKVAIAECTQNEGNPYNLCPLSATLGCHCLKQLASTSRSNSRSLKATDAAILNPP